MVKSGHAATADVLLLEFQNSRHPTLQLEAFPLSDLFRRAPAERLQAVQRLQFHLWVVFTKGACKQMVDFEVLDCEVGTVLHLRPGQVHRWYPHAGLEGHVVAMAPAWMPPVPARQRGGLYRRFVEDDAGPAVVTLPSNDRKRVFAWFAKLEAALQDSDDSAVSVELLGHLVAVALLDVFRSCATAPTEVSKSDAQRMQLFHAALERSYRVTRRVQDYATALGWSTKTLDRACRAATGISAKARIDARVLLESKRYLAHTDETIDAIGADLGFSEATNFVKFFKARSGEVPSAFRKRFRGERPVQRTTFGRGQTSSSESER